MLTIRKEQYNKLQEATITGFENRMLAHLTKFFPERCEALGTEGTLGFIRYSVPRAAKYGIVAERDVCIFADIMIVLGKDFDEDPEFPWAKNILGDEEIRGIPEEAVDRLCEAAVRHIKAEVGSSGSAS